MTNTMVAMFEGKTKEMFSFGKMNFLVMQKYCIVPAFKHGRREKLF